MADAAVTKHKDLSERTLGFLLLLPAALLLCLIVFYPIANLVYDSFFKILLTQPWLGEPFVGFENYARAMEDDALLGRDVAHDPVRDHHCSRRAGRRHGVGVAREHAVQAQMAGASWLVAALGAAAGLRRPHLPLVLRIQAGFRQRRAGALGIEPLGWLTDPHLAVAAICIAIVWKTSSFMALMLLAGLQTIPRSLYEAAEVDGATRWQQFWEITIPMLRPAIFVALIFRTITAIQTFDIPYAMTGGGPGDSTETLAMYIHKTTLDFLDFGYGSALATLMFLLSMALTSGYLKYTRRSSGRGGEG